MQNNIRPKEKKNFVYGAPGDENNSHTGGHKNIFLENVDIV